MAKEYTFTVTVTLCEEYKYFAAEGFLTRECALKELRDWLKWEERSAASLGHCPFEKIEVI